MKRTLIALRIFGLLAVAAFVAGLAPGQSRSATLTTLVNFNGTNGSLPYAGLIADANGNLFGTTYVGGEYGYGTVFEIAKTATGYASIPTTLVSFCALVNCADGAAPYASLIADTNGNLLGTTAGGGAYGEGTVFEVAKTASGYASTPTTLVYFNGTNGNEPYAALIADANGNLFGTTMVGGEYGYGTVFEVAKTASGYASTPTTLVSFNGTNGAYPQDGLIADANSNLFGTALRGGAYGGGTVFEITKTANGYASTPTTLVSFNGADGAYPSASLIADANGDLFSTTSAGGEGYDSASGGFSGSGTVFEIAKTANGYASTPTTLVDFYGTDGVFPYASLIADANGDLFGTTGAGNGSTVFEVAKTTSGYASTPTTLVSFNGTDGENPYAGLIADAKGNLFGTTVNGGAYGNGTAFEITGSGFVPPVLFAGTPGTASCIGVSISILAHTYGGITHAAAGLGYASVSGLQSAIAAYCGG